MSHDHVGVVMRRTKIAIAVVTAAALTVTIGTFAGARRRVAPRSAPASAATTTASSSSAAKLPLAKSNKKVPIKFGPANVVDVQRLGAEPEIHIDSQNNVYVTAPIGIQYAQSF